MYVKLSITVQKLLELTSVINSTFVCKGNFEEKYTSLPNIRDGALMDQSSEFLAILCSSDNGHVLF